MLNCPLYQVRGTALQSFASWTPFVLQPAAFDLVALDSHIVRAISCIWHTVAALESIAASRWKSVSFLWIWTRAVLSEVYLLIATTTTRSRRQSSHANSLFSQQPCQSLIMLTRRAPRRTQVGWCCDCGGEQMHPKSGLCHGGRGSVRQTACRWKLEDRKTRCRQPLNPSILTLRFLNDVGFAWESCKHSC